MGQQAKNQARGKKPVNKRVTTSGHANVLLDSARHDK